MTVGFGFLIGFLIGGCCSATGICCVIVKHLVKHKNCKND